MIKRRYYKLDHGDRDAPSESSSSSSDSELEAEATDGSEDEDEEEANVEVVKKDKSGSSSSGYESEDSSAHEVNLDSSGLPTSDEDGLPDSQSLGKSHLLGQGNTDPVDLQPNAVEEKDEKDILDVADCVVRHKSVFKCRLCPRIVCLSEETLNAHLKSKESTHNPFCSLSGPESLTSSSSSSSSSRTFKENLLLRHARSEKLLKEGRLKLILDKDGKFDEETAPTVASEENSGQSQRKKRGWRGQKKRKKRERPSFSGARQSTKNSAKKRHKDN